MNCYNSSEAQVFGYTNSGGIVGENSANGGKIINCYNLGFVNGEYAGGIEGYHSFIYGQPVINSFSTSNITGDSGAGGIAGDCNARTLTAYNCYYIKSQTLQNASGNGGLTNTTGLDKLDADTIGALNNYIENNADGQDTTGCAKWQLGTDGNPTLDFNTTWNGEEWISNN